MIDLRVPSTTASSVTQLLELLGPIGVHPYWVGVVNYLVAEKGVLIYTADRPAEHQNLSNWFALLNDRSGFYPLDDSGQLVRALYIAHELAHMVSPTPQSVGRQEFAEAFDRSERYASYVTELGIYGDLPELMDMVPWRPLLARILSDKGVDLRNARALMSWRDAVISEPSLLWDAPTEAARMASYGQNIEWASAYWDRLERIGWWAEPIVAKDLHLEAPDSRSWISTYVSRPIDEQRWQTLVVDNVRRAYRLCGRSDPRPTSIVEAQSIATDLNGRPLAVEETAAALGWPCEEEVRWQ